MGKALGDYIHLHRTNYKQYGTFRANQGSNSYQIYNDFLKKRTKNLTTVSKETIDVLKARIANDEKAKRERTIIEQEQYNQRLDQVYNQIQQFTSTELLKQFQIEQGFQKGLSNQFVSNNIIKGSITPKQLKNKVNILKQIKEMVKNLNDNKIPATEKNINTLNKLYKKLDINVPLDPSIESTIGRIQKAIDDYSFDQILSNVAGRFGEELVFSVRDVGLGIVNKNLQSTIKEGVVGNEKTKITINKDSFVTDVSEIFKSADMNNNQYIIKETQDKVDVQIIANRENVFASVKDYFDTSKKDVTLQKELSLLYSLTFLNNYLDDFGNHWINLHALNFNNKDRKNADMILKQELAYEALVKGNPFKNGSVPANVFIVIDRASGKVFVDNTKDILLNKFNQIHLENDKIDSLNLQRQNKKASSFEERIIRILSYLHQVKIHAGYKTNFK